MLPDIWWTSEWADLKAYYKDSNGIDGRTYVGGTAWEFTGEGAVYKQNIQVGYSEIILVKNN